jgi:AraC-like DNA-binding protein
MNNNIVTFSNIDIKPDFPLSAGFYTDEDGHVNNPHTHEFWEIGITVSGVSKHIIENDERTIETGDVYIIPKGVYHSYTAIKEWKYWNLFFLPELLEKSIYTSEFLEALFLIHLLSYNYNKKEPMYICLDPDETISINDNISCIANPCIKKIRTRQIYQKNSFFNIMMILSQAYMRTGDKIISDYMHEMIKTIGDNINLETSLILEKIYKLKNHTPQHINLIFKKSFSIPISSYILKMKIFRSCSLLLDTDKSITWIATSLGFYDHSHYIKYFIKTTGTTPGEYRKKRIL